MKAIFNVVDVIFMCDKIINNQVDAAHMELEDDIKRLCSIPRHWLFKKYYMTREQAIHKLKNTGHRYSLFNNFSVYEYGKAPLRFHKPKAWYIKERCEFLYNNNIKKVELSEDDIEYLKNWLVD